MVDELKYSIPQKSSVSGRRASVARSSARVRMGMRN